MARNLFIAAFLTIQLFFGIRGLVLDKLEARGNFSWNMYAHRYECAVTYTVHEADGTTREVDYDSMFRDQASSTRVLHRRSLPALHSRLCRQIGRGERLTGIVSCKLDGAAWTDLVDPTANLCGDTSGDPQP